MVDECVCSQNGTKLINCFSIHRCILSKMNNFVTLFSYCHGKFNLQIKWKFNENSQNTNIFQANASRHRICDANSNLLIVCELRQHHMALSQRFFYAPNEMCHNLFHNWILDFCDHHNLVTSILWVHTTQFGTPFSDHDV